ncbi:hypothetical protein Taro_023913 [Colocasia esculenta]|uniref:Uncharacterized protein n=1 Tax=Colocasia esculenta TaxID=4460 RepID=A0A843VFW4_COLES|nr:hypothetical protein [Colocasia esculenta]
MALVKVVDSCMVVPEVETPKHRLWLSNLDLHAVSGYTANITVYRFNGASDFFCREKLKASLSKALVPFYPLAGRLVRGNDGRPEVNCNAEGVLFLVAETDSTVDEFGDFIPTPEIRKMLVPAVPSSEPPCIVLLLQVTFFRCGGVTLGVAIHHTIVGGPSAGHFINTWAGITRGAENLLPPFLDRGLLRARSPPKVLIEHPFYRLPQKTQEPPATEAKPACSTATFHLSEDQVAALKSTSGHTHLGTFKAVVAYVWRCFCKARGLADDEETSLRFAVDARNRLDPPLPKCFFGNSSFRTEVVAKAGAIVSESLECSANRIHEVTSSLGDEHVRSLVDLLEQRRQEDFTELDSLVLRRPATSLYAVSWLGLPIFETDFGWGKPILVRRVSVPSSGMVYILHNPSSKGGVSLIMSLETECMPAFEKAFYHGLSSGAVVGQ